MRVLVGCEFSGTVRDAFLARGHDAVSCDLVETDADPARHIVGDVMDVIPMRQWDLIIVHPPCTAIAASGNNYYAKGKPGWEQRLASVDWTVKLWERCKVYSPRVCLENPIGVLTSMGGLPRPHYIQPYDFGHPEQKKTGLFLYNLPKLVPTNNVYEEMKKLPRNEQKKVLYAGESKGRWKLRATTYQGIAEAMAEQWGAL